MSTVLFDAAGPRAVIRHRFIGGITLIVVVALFGFVVYRFVETGQFTAQKWELFTFPFVHQKILEALFETLRAFGLAAVLSLILGLLLVVARVSAHR